MSTSYGPSFYPVASLGSKYEVANYTKIGQEKAKMDTQNDVLAKIATAIQTINTYSKDDTLDLKIPQVQKMIESVRTIMPEFVEEMIGEQTDNLTKIKLEIFKEELSRRPETIHPLINQIVSRINQLFQEGNQVMDISVEILKMLKDLILTIIHNSKS